MTKTQAREGPRIFVELAQAIGDRTALQRIREGVHPFRNEPINIGDWMDPSWEAA